MAWQAAISTGSPLMEYGVSGFWCTDGTNVRLLNPAQPYGDVLTPAYLAALGSVFDLHFRFTDEHPVVGVESDLGGLSLTAEGTFQVCGFVIPFEAALVRLPAVQALADLLERAPAVVQRRIAIVMASTITKWFALTGRTFGLTERELEYIDGLIEELITQAAGRIFSPVCLPAWEPTITIRLAKTGEASGHIVDAGSVFTNRLSTSVGFP